MASWLHDVASDLSYDDRRAILQVATGSPGRAMRYLGTGVSQLWRDLTTIAGKGDADLSLTSKLSQSLALKSAGEDYEAFLELTPRFAKTIALASDHTNAPALHDHWITISNIAGAAIPTSADKAASVFEICRLIAAMGRAGSLPNPRRAS